MMFNDLLCDTPQMNSRTALRFQTAGASLASAIVVRIC
jgi:hypothetical protein